MDESSLGNINRTQNRNASSDSFQIQNKDDEDSATEITVLNPDAMEAECELRVLRGDAQIEGLRELRFASGETEKTIRIALGASESLLALFRPRDTYAW